MTQTAVEWLFGEILGLTLQLENKRISYRNWELQMVKLFEQAKEMERQQKRADFTDGYMHGSEPLNHGVIDKWYNNTYGGNK
jgi:hypothetical protein